MGAANPNAGRVLLHWLSGLELGDRGTFVCHNCDNPKCVNPRHLYLGDQTTNVLDRRRRRRLRPARGAKARSTKLTESDVREIRRRSRAGESNGQLARAYGVTPSNVSCICRRITWKHVPGHGKMAPQTSGGPATAPEDVETIRWLSQCGMLSGSLEDLFGMSRSAVGRIVRGDTHVTGADARATDNGGSYFEVR